MSGIKGVVLAGGLGTRLAPLTNVTNKHLLPVYRKPMIHYPIEKLVQAGITEIMIVTGGPFAGDFLKLLGNGRRFGLNYLWTKPRNDFRDLAASWMAKDGHSRHQR